MAPSHRFVVLAALACLVSACRDETTPATDTDGTTGTTTTGSTTSETTTSTETTGDPGEPPQTPVLVSPLDGAAEIAIEGESLCWEPVEDPDGDPVRYHVWLDGILLDQGKLAEPGHEGPCLGPLDFNYEQVYVWTVAAFNPDFPDSMSEQAEPWTFTTAADGFTTTVFEDDFDDDKGWEIGGDALSGAWIRDNPVPTVFEDEMAQPDDCGGGQNCLFTGQNPMAVVDQADVSGGSTTATSPPFDLSGALAATVRLSRFFFKSEVTETGTLFRVELLSPDAGEPDGYRHFVLEQVEFVEDLEGTNMWTPVEFSACGLPMVAGSRLRVTATDLGDGILEAAIDSVVVTAYSDDRVCRGGEGSLCDPEATDPCPGDLLCCGKGVVNTGVYRCSQPVPDIDYDDPSAKGEPFNGELGCDAPNLFVEPEGMNVEIDQILVVNDPQNANYCALLEGCVGGTGVRKVLRFDTQTPNDGSRDLVMGVPSNHPDLFHYSACHDHYHFDGYAEYELLDSQGETAASGHKQAFCLLDWNSWAWPGDFEKYTCSNQGISAGWRDVYGSYLDCQWIDITDVAPGQYTLRISVNPPRDDTTVAPLIERDYDDNVLEMPVTVP
jgi:hypothetical protein